MATPILAYHGTNFEFDEFDRCHLGVSCDNPTTYFGFFFTESLDDAWTWASRAAGRRRTPDSPRVVVAKLGCTNLLEMSYPKFHFYLQKAKVSTIQRHMAEWKAAGFDGFTVVREGVRWYLPFDVRAIQIVDVIHAEQDTTRPKEKG